MRLIDADELMEWIWRERLDTRERIASLVERMPTIDPVKHGEWVYKGVRGRFPVCECSVCGNAENADWAILGDNVNYCPNCGARME